MADPTWYTLASLRHRQHANDEPAELSSSAMSRSARPTRDDGVVSRRILLTNLAADVPADD